MQEVIAKFEAKQRKKSLPQVRSGDTVRVHQKVREAGRERIQVFEGMVIRSRKRNSLQSTITVRKVASGVGVEKIFSLHSPTIIKIEVVRHSRVRRNYLTYIRKRAGRSAKLRERAEREAERLARLKHEQFEKDDAEAVRAAEKSEGEDKADAKKDEAKSKPEKKETKEEESAKDKPAKAGEADSGEKKETKDKDSPVTDKAQTKKEKAEEFRKSQEAKKK